MGKKHFQSCGIEGSIYGKERAAREKNRNSDGYAVGGDLMAGYDKLYKNQFVRLNKLFRREK